METDIEFVHRLVGEVPGLQAIYTSIGLTTRASSARLTSMVMHQICSCCKDEPGSLLLWPTFLHDHRKKVSPTETRM